jgi:hypothetical protein
VKSDGFRAAAEGKDFSAIEELFAEDATFRSPVVFKQYEGRDTIAMILRAVAEVSDDFRYTDQIENGDTAVLVFEARVGDRELNGVDILHFDAEGKIEKMMVMVRPMSGLQALAQAMEQRLAAATDSG